MIVKAQGHDGSEARGTSHPDVRRTALDRRGFLARLAMGGAAAVAGSMILPRSAQAGMSPAVGSKAAWRQASVRMARLRRETIDLFNGRDLEGWDAFLVEEGVGRDDVWSVEEGILVCKGEPGGYLYTLEDYQDFRLTVEWRWPEEPGNSGVLMRITPAPVMLPNSVEAQLRSGNAGDMYGFSGFRIGGDEERLTEIPSRQGWRLARIEGAENEPGAWNRYEITALGGRITVLLNGTRVNEATDCDIRPGRIGLQSEGGVVHFRTVTLTPLSSR